MRQLTILCALVLTAIPVLQCQASEKDELAQVLRQLDQVQAGLDRARVLSNQNAQNARFYFDYTQASRDISTMRQGISQYLEPSRAQPATPQNVSGRYRGEEPTWR